MRKGPQGVACGSWLNDKGGCGRVGSVPRPLELHDDIAGWLAPRYDWEPFFLIMRAFQSRLRLNGRTHAGCVGAAEHRDPLPESMLSRTRDLQCFANGSLHASEKLVAVNPLVGTSFVLCAELLDGVTARICVIHVPTHGGAARGRVQLLWVVGNSTTRVIQL